MSFLSKVKSLIVKDSPKEKVNQQFDLTVINSVDTVPQIVEAVKNLPVYKEEHVNFLAEHKEHLNQVMHKTWIWRTDTQKRSIINDVQFPTVHAKFHQAMLEQKVQFDQSLYLARDFEKKKLEVEELYCELNELGDSERDNIKRKKIELDIKFNTYELQNMKIAMDYRMKEVSGWQKLIDEMLTALRNGGMPEEAIWNKDQGEVANMFFYTLNNLQGIRQTTDSAEFNNLMSLASWAIKEVQMLGIYDKLKNMCNSAQLDSIRMVEDFNSRK